MTTKDRQTGRTTRQMLDAPDNSVYVWPNLQLDYPEKLAQSLGRNDLRIVHPDWLHKEIVAAAKMTAIIIDHATILSDKQHQVYEDWIKTKEWFEAKNKPEKPTIHDLGYIEEMRQRLGAETEGDTRFDSQILAMTPRQRVRLIAGWELGDPSWADTFEEYFASQGLYLTTDPTSEGVINK